MVVEIKDKNLYYVGGVVRDEILGVQSFDTDFCYEGNAIDFARTKGFEIVRENPDFGTVRVLIDNKEVDIASTRTEQYPKKGHLPIVDNIGCALRDDLARRDFTINAMAKNTVTGEIIDYFGGLEDIKNKKIRVLHSDSFIDDPTRIVRALKFAVRFGFKLDDATKKLQDEYLLKINYDMSYHRLKKELKETFNLNSIEAYQNFVKQNIYKLLGPEQTAQICNFEVIDFIREVNPENIWLVYAGLYNLSRLELTKTEQEIIDNFNLIKNIKPESEYDIYSLFKNCPVESILMYAFAVDFAVVKIFFKSLKNIRLELTGDDIRELGIQPGEIYREIFDYLYEQKIKGLLCDKEDEINAIRGKYL